jgi:hypothetical protein
MIMRSFSLCQASNAVNVSICEGGPEAGPLGMLSQSERFHWLVSPRSTIIQISPTHEGVCDDPAAALEHVFKTMVLL